MRKQTKTIFYRVNWQIRASPIRVIDSQGKQLGVLPLGEARALAQKEGLDLVEIAPRAKPPVVKLIDYAKFKYQEQKKRRQEHKKQKRGEVKEFRFSPFVEETDAIRRLQRAKKFSREGKRLKITIRFRGRQFTRQQFGYDLIDKIAKILEEDYQIEDKPKIIGKRLVAFFKPKKHEEEKAEN